jgi:uncharacterized protein YggT (Ycf19 family)
MSATALMLGASAREQVANYVEALVTVYWIIILAYILTQWIPAFGGRIPYSRWSDAVLGFLRDASEPYLRIFRRFIPPLGPLDLSAIAAIVLLVVVGNLVAGLIRG